jgi:hypothetical protein
VSDERPLDLSSLGDVDAPDAVRDALRRFRRRVATTGMVVALSAISLAGGIAWAMVLNRTLPEQVAEAPGVDVGAVFSGGGTVTVVERVARLDYGVALHLYLAAPDAPRGASHFYELDDVLNFEESGGRTVHDYYYVVRPPSDGVVRASLQLQTGCRVPPGGGMCATDPEGVHTFTIDLADLGVPQEIWR